jgi:hypothetical protein
MTWSAVGTIPASDVADLAGRSDGALLVLSQSGTLWLSLDGGVSFAAGGTLTASNLVSLLVGVDETLYALAATGEVWRSVDDGAAWLVVGTMPVSDGVSLRRMGSVLYVLTGSGWTYRSLDDGATWAAVGTVSQVGMTGLTWLESELVAVNETGLVARSGDGSAWTWVGTVNQVDVVAVSNDVPQVTGVPGDPVRPAGLVLAPPRPNPARSGQAVRVEFALPDDAEVWMALYDLRGRLIAEQGWERFEAGEHGVSWTLPELAPGVYFLWAAIGPETSNSHRLVVMP